MANSGPISGVLLETVRLFKIPVTRYYQRFTHRLVLVGLHFFICPGPVWFKKFKSGTTLSQDRPTLVYGFLIITFPI